MTDFRPCLACLPNSQANLYHYALKIQKILSLPLYASVTLWEATAPVKLPTMHGLEYQLV